MSFRHTDVFSIEFEEDLRNFILTNDNVLKVVNNKSKEAAEAASQIILREQKRLIENEVSANGKPLNLAQILSAKTYSNNLMSGVSRTTSYIGYTFKDFEGALYNKKLFTAIVAEYGKPGQSKRIFQRRRQFGKEALNARSKRKTGANAASIYSLDKIGRIIGFVAPAPHLTKALEMKKDEARDLYFDIIMNEVMKIWRTDKP